MKDERLTITQLRDKRDKGDKLTMLTAYDYPVARIVDAAGVDMILVGDSLGMVVLGYDSTLPVTVDDMIHHGRAVVRGSQRAMVVIDMPFMSYRITVADTVRNAGRVIQATGAQAVKLEGGRDIVGEVQALVRAGIPVMGHVGLMPQSVNQQGGFKVQGKDENAARELIEDALCLEQAGAFALVLESIPRQLAALITERINIPTIGIGAGAQCDGQVLVTYDMVGLFDGFVPKFVKQYAQLRGSMVQALAEYVKEVKAGQFPAKEHTFTMKDELYHTLKGADGSEDHHDD